MLYRVPFAEGAFQSTCLREARHLIPDISDIPKEFQSTCLREARPSAAGSGASSSHFNPRAYVRHDPGERDGRGGGSISIHVPT